MMFFNNKITVAFLALLVGTSNAFSGMTTAGTAAKPSTTSLSAEPTKPTVSRSAFLSGVAGAVLLPASAAFAETDKGSARELEESDFKGLGSKGNQRTCMDRCMYEKNKAGLNKVDSFKECSAECSSAKGQLTSETPGKDS